MEQKLYTEKEVRQIVEQTLHFLVSSSNPPHLDKHICEIISPFETKPTLTVEEAAKLIGISKPNMYNIARSKKIRTLKIGRKILISRQSLLDWIEKGEFDNAET